MKPLSFFKKGFTRLFQNTHFFIQLNQRDKKLKRIESGRSMVEMLGVLAVIGVLSVGGILGYKYGITKWKANETVNELNLRARDISFRMEKLIELDHTGEIEMEMGNVTRLGYPIEAWMSPLYIDYFEMFLSEVPSDVCKELLKSQWQAPYSIFVGVTEYEAAADICDQAEEVELAYEFYKDLSQREDIPEEKQHKTQRCNHDNNCQCGTCNKTIGLCETYCTDMQECKKDYDNVRQMRCCDKDTIIGDYCCSSVTPEGYCCNSKKQCCPPTKPMIDVNGNCHACNEAAVIIVPDNDCSVCASTGRFLVGDGWGRKGCGLPCSAEKPLRQYEGSCFKCDTSTDVNVAHDYSACDVCGDQRVRADKWCRLACPDSTPMMDGTTCNDCSYTNAIPLSAIPVGKTCSGLCPDREVRGNYCVLKKCPPTKPMVDINGSCHACNETGVIIVPDNDCSVCASTGRFLVGDGWGRKGCGLPCPAEKPLRQYEGSCFECNTSTDVNVAHDSSACDVCGDQRVRADKWCRLACPDSTPMMDGTNCNDCSYTNAIPVSAIPVGKTCSGLCPNREVRGNYCVLKTCPSTKPMVDINGSCHACNETGVIIVPDNDCSVCASTGRFLVDNGWGRKGCGLPCPAEKPLRQYEGSCFECNTSTDVNVAHDSSACDVCADNRTLSDKWCRRDHCLSGFFEGKNGVCYKCNDPVSVAVTDEESCMVCLNRVYQNGFCVDNS